MPPIADVLRLFLTLRLVEVASENALNDANHTQDAQADAHVLPAQATALVQTPGAVAKEATEANDADEVDNGEGASAAVAEGGELPRQPAVGTAGLVSGLLLGELGLGTSLLLAIDTIGLRLGLHLLLEVIGGDSADGLAVDVDEGRGRRLGVGLDLDGRGRAGLFGGLLGALGGDVGPRFRSGHLEQLDIGRWLEGVSVLQRSGAVGDS